MADLTLLRTTTLVRLFWSARDKRRGLRAALLQSRTLGEILARKDRLPAGRARFNLTATYSQDTEMLNWPKPFAGSPVQAVR